MLNRKGIQLTGVYSIDPYLGPRSGGSEEELTKLRKEVALLKSENSTLKARMRGEHTLFGGNFKSYPGSYASYGRGTGRGGSKGARGANSGRTYGTMSARDKQDITCIGPSWEQLRHPTVRSQS